jgi:hypothetical protein
MPPAVDDPDTFFTLTIVGAPASLMLGRRMAPAQARAQGLDVDLGTGLARLTETWRDHALLGRPQDDTGRPRRRPGPTLRWMERHALGIALAGTAALAASFVIAGVVLWA